ncbi:fox-2 multifunctional beta-oxidation [Fusarium subglutinans]|uniref:Fox-2 multifunctional beta-oxidation n=1 Tax=Gibberella subglutinans TaxID=42677 RepID=A0A8H5Q1V2_GIBSU|nr:fox-2 multifunctional beta-oxidation [Fusarium subglutinans]KAF5606487.1 fox-2 multifunctional beta-oxidation [Fusarium subglutinans]
MSQTKLTSLQGRVAIVTGAGGGLGREYALLLASYGAKVVVNDYGGSLSGQRGTISRAQTVVDEIKAKGGEAIADGHDISVQCEAQELVQDTLAAYGTIHILVNNAGTAGEASSHDDVNVQSFRRTWEIAALGTVMLIGARQRQGTPSSRCVGSRFRSRKGTSITYPTMEKQGYGRIVNTSSDSLIGMGAGGDGGYVSSKGATFGLTRDLGRMSPKHGIKINGVLPSAASRMSDLSPVIKRITREYFHTHLVADFVVALCSAECPISGELFSVGGGRAARTTLATVPGHSRATGLEDYLAHFDKVIGTTDELFVPKDTLDLVSYAIKQATGTDVGVITLD